jgi:membrane protease YdiL (CAAX protease family)
VQPGKPADKQSGHRDKRITALTGRSLAYQVAVRIPVGTVLWEETAFRGVLQAALRRVMSERAAIVVTSGVFGIWHIRPTSEALRINGLADDRAQPTAGIAAAVAVTTAGGVRWLGFPGDTPARLQPLSPRR